MVDSASRKTTHFGYQEVPWEDKVDQVADVFHSVADQYDLMNDLMSLGIHRLWKRYTLALSGLRAGQKVLDLAGGSGDLSKLFAKKVGETGEVVLADINSSMLAKGRERVIDAGFTQQMIYTQANAEQLPYANDYFDCVCIAFGLRNVTDKAAAIRSMYRVLRPGGRLLILEFSKPSVPGLQPIYDWYSFKVLPWLGETVLNDKDSYQYLAESIRMHPDQETLKQMILTAGFEDCDYYNLSGGIVALHRAFKY